MTYRKLFELYSSTQFSEDDLEWLADLPGRQHRNCFKSTRSHQIAATRLTLSRRWRQLRRWYMWTSSMARNRRRSSVRCDGPRSVTQCEQNAGTAGRQVMSSSEAENEVLMLLARTEAKDVRIMSRRIRAEVKVHEQSAPTQPARRKVAIDSFLAPSDSVSVFDALSEDRSISEFTSAKIPAQVH